MMRSKEAGSKSSISGNAHSAYQLILFQFDSMIRLDFSSTLRVALGQDRRASFGW
jgi:hypothetical protein